MKIPIYLSGAIRKELAGKENVGLMRTPKMGNKPIAGMVWFADNGCFSVKGERDFNLDAYLTWLRKQDASTCLGATAPDKVGNAYETTMRSLPVLPLLREIGYKASYVAQDGLQLDTKGNLIAIHELDRTKMLSVPWDSFDVLFIGGSTEWKLGSMAARITAEAKRRGKWVHMGRVNSYIRYRYAAEIGCDSVDGTFIAFAPAINIKKVDGWLKQLALDLAQQPRLFRGGFRND